MPIAFPVFIGAVTAFGEFGKEMGEKTIADLKDSYSVFFSVAVHGVNLPAAVGKDIAAVKAVGAASVFKKNFTF